MNFRFPIPMYGVALANALNLLFAVLHILLVCSSKLSLLPILTRRIFSEKLVLIKESPGLIEFRHFCSEVNNVYQYFFSFDYQKATEKIYC